MRFLTAFITGIVLLSMIAVVAVACGDDDTSSSGAKQTVQNAQTVAATSVQGIASAVVTNVQGAATAVVTRAQGAASAVASKVNGATVGVTEKDFSINLDNSTASSGPVVFNIKNEGPTTHEFVVIKTDTAEDKLPMNSSGSAVDTSAAGLQQVDQKQDISSGSTATLTISNLEPGKYVLICNLPGHYQLGMHTSLTVK
jgi:uncharacterized cupredoxin-like copper-binding protein